MTPFKMFYSTDWHAKGKNPDTRIDDFRVTIEKKIRIFFEIGADSGCDAYGVGGDFIDTHFLSPPYIIRMAKIIQKELRRTKKKLYYILGNHDVIAYDPASIFSTNFGIFLALMEDEMILLTKKPIEEIYHGRPIALSGVSSYSMLDKPILDPQTSSILQPRSRDWIVEETIGTMPHIHMAHGFLSPSPILEDIPHTVIEEMRHTQATITLGAHDHTGFPVTQIDNGLVYNPGALGRVFASHMEMIRMPKYAMCTIYADGTPEIMPVQCPIAEPGHLVMDRSKIDERNALEALRAQAGDSVQRVIQSVNTNIGKLDIPLLAARYKETVRPAVYQEAMKRLGW